jgi:mycofactocin system glycosyltransferase
MLNSGRLEVHDAQSAQLARTLLDATVAHPRPASGPSHRDVTIVIPVLNNAIGLRRLVSTLRGMCVVVVDDGSSPPVRSDDFAGLHCDVRVLRHPVSKGPAAARNAGLAVCQTDFVAFLDSDVVPRRGWLEALLGHFCDPAVALVAPRIVALNEPHNMVARYEAVRSSLDLGQREAPVVPYGTVSYVPSAAIICRRTALENVGGFDETLRSGEDVDLCWRFVEAKARLRYEPIALVGHDHRTTLRKWFARKAFYGSSAAPLAVRHPGKTAPLVLSGWTLLVWLLLAMGSGVGYVASTVVAAITGRKIAKVLSAVDTEPREVAAVAAQGLWSAALQLASAICRHYWPIALVAAVCFRRCRQVVLVAAVVDGVVDWASRNGNVDDDAKRVGLFSYVLLKRLDDIAYGLGLWQGVVRERHLGALKPQIRT